jgi:hypothetical protein
MAIMLKTNTTLLSLRLNNITAVDCLAELTLNCSLPNMILKYCGPLAALCRRSVIFVSVAKLILWMCNGAKLSNAFNSVVYMPNQPCIFHHRHI